jgi:hypothetical protein
MFCNDNFVRLSNFAEVNVISTLKPSIILENLDGLKHIENYIVKFGLFDFNVR